VRARNGRIKDSVVNADAPKQATIRVACRRCLAVVGGFDEARFFDGLGRNYSWTVGGMKWTEIVDVSRKEQIERRFQHRTTPEG